MTTIAPVVAAEATKVFPRLLDAECLSIERGEGVRLYALDGREILDACGGGAMVASLGHGRRDMVEAAERQAQQVPYVYYHHFTNDLQERYGERLLEVAAPSMARARFVTGGSEANEMALRLARQYHEERGDTNRWRVVSPAQAYHGATVGALGLTGRPALQAPYEPYLVGHLHIPPSTTRSDPTGERALAALDRVLEEAGDSIAAYFCEPISAAALPAYSPPARFWEGLAERRKEHGFLVCFDEIVTGFGRTGTWFAADQVPLEPDIVSFGKGAGAGYTPLAGILCRRHVYEAIDSGSKNFEHGHTWDGAPLLCAVGLAVLEVLERERLVESVAARGPSVLEELRAAIERFDIVGEVRGRGFLLGFELVDPRDGESILPAEIGGGALVDEVALEHGLLTNSSSGSKDGYASDQTLLSPAFTSTGAELTEMLERLAAALEEVDAQVKAKLSG
jgi:adenosylmethionine-8-amino-7-oxononanoate aminotransferase